MQGRPIIALVTAFLCTQSGFADTPKAFVFKPTKGEGPWPAEVWLHGYRGYSRNGARLHSRSFNQIDFARRCFAEFERAQAFDDVPSVFFNLHHFIVLVANVDKLLDPKPGSQRASLLAGQIDLSDMDLKTFRRLRNHLEHFDERLDMWVANYDGHAFFDMNIVTGAKGFPTKAFLRALDGDIFKFHGEDYPLQTLRDAVETLHSRLSSADT